MFRIFDGREHFYQWDSDCKLIIDDGRISAVHFCNRTIDYAIVCNVYKENGQYLVNVPNIFFQSDRDLHVYAYDDNHTLYEETYKVYARSKPADYVYKDEEVLTWARIEQRVTDLENTVSTEGIAQAVQDYMAANPIQIPDEYLTESELEAKGYITTIPSEYITEEELSSKGYLTSIPAEYVTETELNAKGYLTEHQDLSGYALKSEIPDDYILPTASATTLGGVKIGSGLSITDDGVLSAEGGGGSGDITDVLMDVTIEEAVAAVTVTLDTPRAYKELYIATCVYGDESNSSANAMFLRVNNTGVMGDTNAIAYIPNGENATSATAKSYGVAFVKLLDDCSFYYCYGSKSTNARTPNSAFGEMYTNFNRDTIISTLKFQSINQWTNFGVGSTIKVYGVRS